MKTITLHGKTYEQTVPAGNCYECPHEEPCKNFHCVSAMCGITGYCLGYEGKSKDCPFKTEDHQIK